MLLAWICLPGRFWYCFPACLLLAHIDMGCVLPKHGSFVLLHNPQCPFPFR